MRNPIDTVKGKVVDYDPFTGEMTIQAFYDDPFMVMKREYSECLVQMVDGRSLSDKQRNACYVLIKEIADFTGMGVEMTKQWAKIKFLTDDLQATADKIFSLSNAPMSLVCEFQRFLVRLIIDFEIPTSFQLSKYVDDVQDYVYACATKKKCCVCGRPAEAHHWKRIGMGADRTTMDHIGWPIEPLCREHHVECHNTGQEAFDKTWHIEPVKVDKMIAKVFKLNTKEAMEHEID